MGKEVVALKVKKFNGLCILWGSIGKDNCTISSIQIKDLALLWHNRLGNTSENCL